MKQIFSVRSPLWQIVTTVLFFPFAMLITYSRAHDTQQMNSIDQLVLFASGAILLLLAIYSSMIMRYNRANPRNKISLFGFAPAELKEEDEGMRMITARATRRVYTYHSFALPLLAVVIVYAAHSVYLTLAGLMVVTLGHYITYWIGIWPAFSEESDEN